MNVTEVVGDRVQCAFQARAVSIAECAACLRGFLVRIEPDSPYALCPKDLMLTTVGDIMGRKLVSVQPDLPIEKLILLLVDEGVPAVAVLDAGRRPLGVVGRSDLILDDYEWADLRDEARQRGRGAPLRAEAPDDDFFLGELFRSRTVLDLVTRAPVTVTPATRLADAARLLTQKHVEGCAVVDGDGKVIGLLTARDVARWVAAQG